MAARTCIYTDPKKPGDGPRLWMGHYHAWEEDVLKAFEAPSLSYAQGVINSAVPIGYKPAEVMLASVAKPRRSV